VREGSFTRAAALLGVSPSALSHAVKGLEARLGVQLLTRTTRRIATTEAGDRLYTQVAPRFEQIDAEVAAVVAMGDKPAGTIRITAAEHAVNSVLWPKLSPVLHQHPDIHVEISVDYALSDIVAQRFDAGVRLGDQVARDMIAVRISADQRMAVVASPAYFATRPRPATPADLAGHNCINLRLPTHGGLLQWDFEKQGRQLNCRVAGNGSSTAARPSSGPRWPATVWPSFLKTWFWSMWPQGSWYACWTTGASPIRATTCTTRIASSPRFRCRSSSKPCGTGSRRARGPPLASAENRALRAFTLILDGVAGARPCVYLPIRPLRHL
jgi:DNA-binding transcriptional LysR family regulator